MICACEGLCHVSARTHAYESDSRARDKTAEVKEARTLRVEAYIMEQNTGLGNKEVELSQGLPN